jgi:hypothetical protein
VIASVDAGPEIGEGDYVTIGESKLTWKVLPISGHHPAARLLESGATGCRRLEWIDGLHLFQKGEIHAA